MSLPEVFCWIAICQLGLVVWVVAPRMKSKRQMERALDVSIGVTLALTALALVIHHV